MAMLNNQRVYVVYILINMYIHIYRDVYIYTHHTLYVLDGMPTINPFFQMRVMWRQDGFPSWG